MNDTAQNSELVERDENSPGVTVITPQSGEITPLTMLNMAVQQGSDIESLRELMALKREWEADEARKAYAKAMSLVQEEMPVVLKTAQNKQTGSLYAKEETISKIIKPIYTKGGFSLSFNTGECPLESHIRVICSISHAGGHIEKIYVDYPYDCTGIKGTVNKTKIHGYKSTYSYAKNTLTCMAFNVATGDDDDAVGATIVESITEEQAADLKALMEEVGADHGKFCQYMGVTALIDIPVSDHQKAITALEAKRGK